MSRDRVNGLVMAEAKSKTEVLMRAVSEILAPVGLQLRELGYKAELIASEEDGTTIVKLVVIINEVAAQ